MYTYNQINLEINDNMESEDLEEIWEENNEILIDESAQLEKESTITPIFSAIEVGKVAITINKLKQITGYDYSNLPLETSSTQEIYDLYLQYPKLDFIPIINESGWITGYFTRKSFLSLISANNYNRELLFRKDVTIKSFYNSNVICANAYNTLTEISEILINREESIRFDPFVITLDRKFFGISTVDKVLKGINTFLNRDFEAIKNSQDLLVNYFYEHEQKIKNYLNFTSYIKLLIGPGGDFVNKYEINEDYSLVVLMDVCGKGIKASSMVLTAISLLNKQLEYLIKHKLFNNRYFYKELLELNKNLITITSPDLYATVMFIIVNKKQNIITVYDFGHNLLWIKRKNNIYRIDTDTNKKNQTSFLGIQDNITIFPVSYQLKKDDIVFGCSDGITEQINPEKKMFIEKIEETLGRFKLDLKKNKKIMLKDWNSFRQNMKIRDDISFFIFMI